MARAPIVSIVDDEDSLRITLASLLRSAGFQALTFASAEAFLTSTEARASACVILDMRMVGMNGLELQRQIMATNWRVPIIFITSYVDDDVRARALEAGAVEFLPKPLRAEKLLNALEVALRTP
jgi:FixJ family two-component response regulator